MKVDKKIERTIQKLNRYFEYAEKKLAIHEASHVVFAYLMGHSCNYMQTGLRRDVKFRNNNIEIDAQSISQIYNIFPPFLGRSLQLITIGHSISNISAAIGVSTELIRTEVQKLIIVLLSGYEAENHFYNSIRYWFIKRIPIKYSMDLTPSDFRHDTTKINFLAQKMDISSETLKKYQRSIVKGLDNKVVRNTCFELANKCLLKTRLSQAEIESILLQTGFDGIKQSIAKKLFPKI